MPPWDKNMILIIAVEITGWQNEDYHLDHYGMIQKLG